MKHSVYFEGKVQSLGVNTTNGFATVGVIEPGMYTFSTSSEEHIVLIEGTLRVRLPGQDWKVFSKGQEIVVQPNVSFDIEARLERIMETRVGEESVEILTTDEKLAQRIGREIRKAYQGTVSYKWSEDANLVRVNWARYI